MDRSRREKMCRFIAQNSGFARPLKESLVPDRHWQKVDAKLAKLREKVEQNLWTEDSRKADSADFREMPLARKRKEPEN